MVLRTNQKWHKTNRGCRAPTYDCHYPTRKVYLSMPKYVKHALHRLQNSLPKRLQQALHRHNKPTYEQRIQISDPQDNTKEVFLPASAKTLIHQIIGIFSLLWNRFWPYHVSGPGYPSNTTVKTNWIPSRWHYLVSKLRCLSPRRKFVYQPVTWSYIFLAMDPTFLRLNYAAVLEEFST